MLRHGEFTFRACRCRRKLVELQLSKSFSGRQQMKLPLLVWLCSSAKTEIDRRIAARCFALLLRLQEFEVKRNASRKTFVDKVGRQVVEQEAEMKGKNAAEGCMRVGMKRVGPVGVERFL